MAENVGLLHTEQRNPDTVGIADMSTLEMVSAINCEDLTVAQKVRQALPQIAAAVDCIAERMRKGGRLIYAGAGTSGRLATVDASECPPTYGVDCDRVQCVMAGGKDAVFRSKEAVEDSPEAAKADLEAVHLSPLDTVVALAASGRTPYCVGALDYARSLGAGSVSVSCNTGSVMARHADIAIEVDTGREVIMGSTRMKAGTAQKMILNMLSTAVMVKLGRTNDNLMICLRAKNDKIGNRVLRLFTEATGETDAEKIREILLAGGGRLDVALAMYKSGKSREEAEQALAEHENFREALQILSEN